MPGIAQIGALPGIGSTVDALSKRILWTREHLVAIPGGVTIDGSQSRDPLNTADITVLQAGLLLGRITASGLFAPCIIGQITTAYADNETSLVVDAATATEVIRRVGTSGTAALILVGPPSAAGTVAATAVTHSAVTVNGATSSLTITDLNVAKVVGSLLCVNDGSYVPRCIITKEDGVPVQDRFGVDYDVQLAEAAIGGFFLHDQIQNWPADASTVAWIKSQLRAGGYAYCFNDDFGF